MPPSSKNPVADSDTEPKPQPSCEADRIRRIRLGDRTAFSELYDRHSPHVYTLAKRMLRCDADAESVVSDVFLEFWRKPERFDESRGTCRTYLLVLARSRSLDWIRSHMTRDERTSQGGEALAQEQTNREDAYQPVSQAIQVERCDQVRQAVDGLEDKQREPLMLAFFEGLTHREIADRLDEPLGTIKTRVRSALQSLRASLRTLGRHDDELP